MNNSHELLNVGQIAERLFGLNTPATRKRVHRIEGKGAPMFRLAGALVARKSVLDEYIEEQEAAALESVEV